MWSVLSADRCRDLWRSAWLKRVILGHPGFESFPAPDEIANASEMTALAESVNRLPAEFKDVVLLYYYQGYGVTEIAEILGIAEGTVSSRLSRARARLQKDFEKGED